MSACATDRCSTLIGQATTIDRSQQARRSVKRGRSRGGGPEPIGEASAPIDERVCNRSVQHVLY